MVLNVRAFPQREGRGLMATVDSAVQVRATTRSERHVRFVTRTPLHFVLIAISLLWLVPTVGLALTSFRKPSDDRLERLVAFDLAVGLDAEELRRRDQRHGDGPRIGEQRDHHASRRRSCRSRLAPSPRYGFAWVPFPFRDTLFLIIVALMIVPIQTSLVPLLKLFRQLGTPQQRLLRDLARAHRLRPAARDLPSA